MGGFLQWSDGSTHERTCPVCGYWGPSALFARIEWPAKPARTVQAYRCEECGSVHVADEIGPIAEYADQGGGGSLDFYIEQGAAVDLLVEQLNSLEFDSIHSYCEFGCGYGFTVDYAFRALGWRSRGVDPSPHAAAGAADLGIVVENRYASSQSPPLDSPYDVVGAFEVIEHLPDPQALTDSARAALDTNGIFLLTTPNVLSLNPSAPEAIQRLIAGPGYHLIFYSAKGLYKALKRGGFEYAAVWENGHGLTAAASDVPLNVDTRRSLDREAFRQYLRRAVERVPKGSAAYFGFQARLLKETINSGDEGAARDAFLRYVAAAKQAFETDFDDPESIVVPSRFPPSSSDALLCLRRVAPLNAAGVLYRAGTLSRLAGQPERACAYYQAAIRFGNALRSALAIDGFDDAETAHLIEIAVKERSLAQVLVDPRAAVEEALISAPSVQVSTFRDLAVAGRLDDAARLFDAAKRSAESNAELLHADDWWALGVFRLIHSHDPMAAAPYFDEAADTAIRMGQVATAWRAAAEAARCRLTFDPIVAAVRWSRRQEGLDGLPGCEHPPEDLVTALRPIQLAEFQRAVADGEYEVAALFARAVRAAASSVAEPGVFWALGLFELNAHRALEAASWFRRTAGLSKPDNAWYWRGLAHEVLALAEAGELSAAQAHLAELSARDHPYRTLIDSVCKSALARAAKAIANSSVEKT